MTMTNILLNIKFIQRLIRIVTIIECMQKKDIYNLKKTSINLYLETIIEAKTTLESP